MVSDVHGIFLLNTEHAEHHPLEVFSDVHVHKAQTFFGRPKTHGPGRKTQPFASVTLALEIFSITTTLDFPLTANSTSSSNPLPNSAKPIG
jgi:hypothetical protein